MAKCIHESCQNLINNKTNDTGEICSHCFHYENNTKKIISRLKKVRSAARIFKENERA